MPPAPRPSGDAPPPSGSTAALVGLGLLGALLAGATAGLAGLWPTLGLVALLGGWLIVSRSRVATDAAAGEGGDTAANDRTRGAGPGEPAAHAGGGGQEDALAGPLSPLQPRPYEAGAELLARAGPIPAPPRRRLSGPRAARGRYRLARWASAVTGGLVAAGIVGAVRADLGARGFAPGSAFYALAVGLLAVGPGVPWLLVVGLWRRKRRREGWDP